MLHSNPVPNPSGPQPAVWDCETAILLRSILLPIFNRVSSWTALIDEMQARDYSLAFRGGTFSIIDDRNGQRLCGLRFLGLSMQELVARMGRPKVVVRSGRHANGELLRDPSELPQN
ncbi:hypothetical protein Q5Y75_03435 [Ruegeria sp. 2205SS24-7]|uniref:hypothetical protein n=1 Tax=Ruegeria discodermiae TaxID=3064389 RepID=UPI0027410F8B|nr:hypothetical protein [Ruegeria sp. 2205SS24-7]MDP5216259.1 hypothetical protein [Ruegeria sp. 2205SS24-7]